MFVTIIESTFPVRMTLIFVTLTSAFEFDSWNAIKWIVFTAQPLATSSTMVKIVYPEICI